MGALSVEASGLRALLNRLVAYKVHSFHGSSNDPDNKADRDVAPLDEADVVSSAFKNGVGTESDRHAVVLDIDHPCYLVKSSTPGHFHLYIDVPGGIEWQGYQHLLGALADAGVIEDGYYRAGVERRATMVRLPWVKKEPAPVPVSGNTVPDPDFDDVYDGLDF